LNYQETVYTAAQGIDAEDFLEHIGWTDALRPKLEAAKATLTKQLVDVTLRPADPTAESREQIAGKLWGLDWVVQQIENHVRRGRDARASLAKANIHLE
jgi:hypothetical protein